MRRTVIIGGLVALSLAMLGSAAPQDKPEARKYTNVNWHKVTNVSYHANKRREALGIVFEHFMPAGQSADIPQPRIFEYATGGEWDITIVWHMPDGPAGLEWEMHPNSIKWMEALAARLGSPEEAEELLDTYMAMVARHDTNLVRERTER